MIPQIVSVVTSFEALFCMFLFAGSFKENPLLSFIPFDLTGISFAGSFVYGIFILSRNKLNISQKSLKSVLLFFTFVCYVLTSLNWSPGIEYASQKALNIAALAFWSFTGAALIVSSESQRIKHFSIIIFILSCWLGLDSLIVIYTVGLNGENLFVNGLNYLIIGRLTGLGLVITFFYYIYQAKNILSRLVSFALIAMFMNILLATGGRGPLLASILSMLIPLVTNTKFSRGENFSAQLKRLIPVLSIVVVSGIILLQLINSDEGNTTLLRLSLLGEGGGDSVNTRQEYYSQALEQWKKNPLFGNGIGSFPVLLGLGDINEYPHNIILEILSELGLIGLSLFLTIIFYSAFKGSIKRYFNSHDNLDSLIIMLVINTLTNSMFSADIPDNRALFSMLGLMMYSGCSEKDCDRK